MAIVQAFPHRSRSTRRTNTAPPALRALPDPPAVVKAGFAMAPTVFHEPWLLEITSRGAFQLAQVHDGGRVVGLLPYTLSRRHGLRVSVMPQLTHVLGPAIDEGGGSSNTRWLRRLGILDELLSKLPRVALFSQTCHPYTADVLGFQGRGFDTAVQFTAEINPLPPEALWKGMRDKTRNVIRRTEERATVTVGQDPAEFRSFYGANLANTGKREYFELDSIVPLHQAAQARDQGQILEIRTAEGRLAAAAFFVWDAQRMWYLLSTRDPKQADNGAVSCLIWHGMQEASRRGLVFDFDGVSSTGSARFFAGFGAHLKPRFIVHRTSPFYAFGKSLGVLLRGWSNRNHFTAPCMLGLVNF